MNREIQQSFLAWLTGQVLPPRPSILDYVPTHVLQRLAGEREVRALVEGL